jgi:hypothetical protein
MGAWWGTLGLAAQFFYLIAGLSSAILLIQLVLSLLGAGGDHLAADGGGLDLSGHLDVGGHDLSVHDVGAHDIGAHDVPASVFSVRTVLAFFVGFGWTGVIMLRSEAALLPTIAVATVVGTLFLLVVFWLMTMIYRLSESGTVDYRNAQGQAGTVYLPIPAQGRGQGQVQLVVQGRMRELPAVTEEAEPLPTGVRVRVVKVLDENTVVVKREL